MDNWAFFDENGNEITRSWQGMRYQARDLAQRYADERGETIEFQTEDSLLCPEDVAIEDWDGPPPGEIVHPSEEPEADEDDLPHVAWLKKHGACAEGISFAAQFKTMREAWDASEDLEHLCWVAMTAAEIKATGRSWNGPLNGQLIDPDAKASWRPIRNAADQAEADAADPDCTSAAVDFFRERVPCPELV